MIQQALNWSNVYNFISTSVMETNEEEGRRLQKTHGLACFCTKLCGDSLLKLHNRSLPVTLKTDYPQP